MSDIGILRDLKTQIDLDLLLEIYANLPIGKDELKRKVKQHIVAAALQEKKEEEAREMHDL